MAQRDITVLKDVALITCVVQRGVADPIISAAREAGAQGATVNYGKGMGIRERLGILGVAVEVEKEVQVIETVEVEVEKEVIVEVTPTAVPVGEDDVVTITCGAPSAVAILLQHVSCTSSLLAPSKRVIPTPKLLWRSSPAGVLATAF